MSDGPHRSLPLRPHWKVLAQRAAKAAHSPAEVCEALPYALKRDILEGPLKAVRDIMGGDSLFPSMRIEQLEALRASCPGSAAATQLIDCAIVAVQNGKVGDPGAQAAVQMALEGTMHSALRSIDEHYQREAGSRSSGYVRERLDAARETVDCGALARELLTPGKPPKRRSVNLRRHTGLDEGPAL
ncbi:conserved hypothetical protein [Nitrobacter winogradskyi Nb-255]|uniref:Uncharacterized protein n=1 Tax=Nitrobacter winogradskyi (strain ATCC 25391 / DSM 10237 / CIP 104748 / NCIMB 11846 / Nb-255) TaxID=323098 RepID=Q3SW11_NITWN|nr:hypothetical protein [Nitrobacter winogradskyi]ABA03530.1 conserved hypothetical protein [Nitrobacter winogradskyi Nb-255]